MAHLPPRHILTWMVVAFGITKPLVILRGLPVEAGRSSGRPVEPRYFNVQFLNCGCKMKKCITFFILVCSSSFFAQTLNLDWAAGMGSSGNDF